MVFADEVLNLQKLLLQTPPGYSALGNLTILLYIVIHLYLACTLLFGETKDTKDQRN